MLKEENKIFKNLYNEQGWELENALKRDDWLDTKKIIEKGRDWIINEIKASELRGRGGAGFSTGLKWSFAPKKVGSRPHYLVINADESEPGTCKDRDILRFEPQKLIEGCLIASYAVNAKVCYVYIRGEYIKEGKRLQEVSFLSVLRLEGRLCSTRLGRLCSRQTSWGGETGNHVNVGVLCSRPCHLCSCHGAEKKT